MKILLLNDRIPPEGQGGAESVAWRLARGLAAAGHEVMVAAATESASFEETRASIRTWHLRARYPERFRAWLSLRNPQTTGALRALLQRTKPDVVNAHNIHFWLSYHSLKQARAAGCAVVFSGHDVMPFAYGKLRHFVKADAREMNLPADYRLLAAFNLRQNRFRYSPFRNPLIRSCLARYPQIRTVPSRALADAYAANDMPPVEVLHNGIDLAEWQPVAEARVEALRQRLDLVGKSVILSAGRLSREKGTLQLMGALDSLRHSLPQARLLVLTAREIDTEIPAEFQHLRGLIRVGGWLHGEDLRAAFQLADVVTTPSIVFDTFPTVNLEAMAMGKPVVATCFGGSAEAVLDGETGFIVNPFDTATFAQRLQRLLADADLRGEMGAKGRQRIAAQFTLERQVRVMVDIFERARASRTETIDEFSERRDCGSKAL